MTVDKPPHCLPKMRTHKKIIVTQKDHCDTRECPEWLLTLHKSGVENKTIVIINASNKTHTGRVGDCCRCLQRAAAVSHTVWKKYFGCQCVVYYLLSRVLNFESFKANHTQFGMIPGSYKVSYCIRGFVWSQVALKFVLVGNAIRVKLG